MNDPDDIARKLDPMLDDLAERQAKAVQPLDWPTSDQAKAHAAAAAEPPEGNHVPDQEEVN